MKRQDWEFEYDWKTGYTFCKAVMVRGADGQYLRETIRIESNPPEKCLYALEQVMSNE